MIFVIDFDGTVTRRDTVDELLEAFADGAWRRIESEWLAGRIGSRRCMAEQLALVRIERPDLARFLARIEIDPTFHAFYHAARRLGVPVIVSDGLDLAIEYLMQNGLLPRMPFYANRAECRAGGMTISFPHAALDCAIGSGVCKCEVSRSYARRFGGATVLIGDGMSDQCIAAQADYVHAKGALARYCQERAIPYAPFESFADVLPQLNAARIAGVRRQATR